MAKEDIIKKEIRLDIVFSIVIKHWKEYIKPVLATFVVASALILMVPRYYSVTVKLAPEYGNSGGSLGDMASMVGIDLGGLTGADAIVPLYYPDVIGSTQFIVPLFDTEVSCLNSDFKGTYWQYLTTQTKDTPWGYAINWVKKKLSESDSKGGKGADEKPSPFRLSKKEDAIYNAIKSSINCTVDKKTDIITIISTAQDPLVATLMADSINQHLQDFIVDYRTRKVRTDLEHYVQITKEKENKYLKLRAEYMAHADANQNLRIPSMLKKREDMEVELQSAFDEYSMAKKQVALAEAKLTEKTPAFTVLQNATVPVKPTGPKRMITVAAFVFLACIAKTVLLIRKYNR